jgi:hypothetical protein
METAAELIANLRGSKKVKLVTRSIKPEAFVIAIVADEKLARQLEARGCTLRAYERNYWSVRQGKEKAVWNFEVVLNNIRRPEGDGSLWEAAAP